jgi:hypothetical protein
MSEVMTTVAPPDVNGLPNASSNVTVTVEVATPSAVIDVGDALIVDVVAEGAPATNATEAFAVPAFPPTVNDTVEVPAVVALVNVAV